MKVISTVPWKVNVRYLGIKLSDQLDTRYLLGQNLQPLLNSTKMQFKQWQHLHFFWMGQGCSL